MIGSFTIVGFVYLFCMKNFRVQHFMTAAVAIVTGLCRIGFARAMGSFRRDDHARALNLRASDR